MASLPNSSQKKTTPDSRSPDSRTSGALLDSETLRQQLTQLADQYPINTWCLAYSGGVDSQVLLHLLHLTQLNVTAVYIDHGLQAQSQDWARHCQYQCEQLNIPLQIIKVDAKPSGGESPEAAARSARYKAFEQLINQQSCLLTAQHRNDQAETVLLQLLRGGSAPGLSAMPHLTTFSAGWHCRPLIGVSQQSIVDYAQKNTLTWVEDPSNQHRNYDRNYLRHLIMPPLTERWPAVTKTLSLFARQQAENAQLLDELAELDLEAALQHAPQAENALNINVLKTLDEARLRNALRFWIKQNNQAMPARAVLQQIVLQMHNTSHDTHSLVSWADVEVRRFRDSLYLIKQTEHDATQVFVFEKIQQTLPLPSIYKTLQLKTVKTSDDILYVLNKEMLTFPLSIRFRQGGERLVPAGRNARHDLKSLFQEADVPVWQRDKIPLLYVGDELVAVVGYWLADGFVVKGEGVLPVVG